jgi:hypothetical protein
MKSRDAESTTQGDEGVGDGAFHGAFVRWGASERVELARATLREERRGEERRGEERRGEEERGGEGDSEEESLRTGFDDMGVCNSARPLPTHALHPGLGRPAPSGDFF